MDEPDILLQLKGIDPGILAILDFGLQGVMQTIGFRSEQAILGTNRDRVGVWSTPTQGLPQTQRRQARLDALNFLTGNQTMAFQIANSFLVTLARRTIQTLLQQNPGGTLTDLKVFVLPGIIVIEATIGVAVGSLGLTISIPLTITSNHKVTSTASLTVSKHTDTFDLAAMFAPFLSPEFGLANLHLDAIIRGKLPDSLPQPTLPIGFLTTVPLPGKRTIEFNYESSSAAAPDDLVLGGNYVVRPRTPSAAIIGPDALSGNNRSGMFSVFVSEVLAPFKVHWSAESGVQILAANSTQTRINFPSVPKQHDYVLTAAVTDAEQVSAPPAKLAVAVGAPDSDTKPDNPHVVHGPKHDP